MINKLNEWRPLIPWGMGIKSSDLKINFVLEFCGFIIIIIIRTLFIEGDT